MPELNINPELRPHYDTWLQNTMSAFRRQHRPLTDEEANVLLICTLNERGGAPVPTAVTGSFLYQVLALRLASLGTQADSWALALLSSLCRGPGEAVMFAHIFAHHARTGVVEKLGVIDVSTVFAWGYPTEEARHAAWDAQKGYALGLEATDNMLDRIPSA